jgi:dihydrofolate reductase
MTTLILYIATSLDGHIARLDGSLDWLPEPTESNGEASGYAQFYNSIEALVMGATTYEQVLEFGEWPQQFQIPIYRQYETVGSSWTGGISAISPDQEVFLIGLAGLESSSMNSIRAVQLSNHKYLVSATMS